MSVPEPFRQPWVASFLLGEEFIFSTMADEPKKRKPGRPKGKPLSEKEIAQRRAAAWKTGKHAESSLGPMVPCKRSVCPLGEEGYPCDLKTKADAAGGITERCAPAGMVDPAVHAAYKRALENQDPSELAPLQALFLSSMSGLASSQLKALMEEGGFAIDQEFVTKDGDILNRLEENPRGKNTLKLLEMLGATADQQQLTPKSKKEGDRDEGAANLFAFLGRSRKALGE